VERHQQATRLDLPVRGAFSEAWTRRPSVVAPFARTTRPQNYTQMTTPTDSHPVRTGVISTVVGTILVAVLAELWPQSKATLVWLWEHVKLIFRLFTADYSTPGWLLAVLGVVTFLASIRVLAALVRGETDSIPAYLAYTTDCLYGAKWRWAWNRQGIANLWCFCPSCDSELVYDDSSCRDILKRSEPRTDFYCEHCDHTRVATVSGGARSYALSAVEREIRRKLRTGEAPVASKVEV
jgi:hypothetical protein